MTGPFHDASDALYAPKAFNLHIRPTKTHFLKNMERHMSMQEYVTDLARDDLDRPFASKEFIIHVHGQEHVSVKTWNEGAKVDAKLDPQIQF